jgi:hypothetical protein
LEAGLVIFGFILHSARAPISTNTLLQELFAFLRMPSENPPAANVERVRAIYKTLQLLRVPTEKIVLAELAEAQRRLEATLANPGLPESTAAYIANAYHSPARNRSTVQQSTQRKAGQLEVTREMLTTLRNQIRVATNALQLPGLHRHQPA